MTEEKKTEEPTLAEQLKLARRDVEEAVHRMQLLKYKQAGITEMLRSDFDALTDHQRQLLSESLQAGQVVLVDKILKEENFQ
jgi:hypothetical protein